MGINGCLESANVALVIAEKNLEKLRLQAEQEVLQTLLLKRQQQEIQALVSAQSTNRRASLSRSDATLSKGLTPYITVLSTQQAHQQASLTQVQTDRDAVRIRLQTIQSLTLSSN